MGDFPKHPGVYAIIHDESGRMYIGSSKNIFVRWKGHRCDLRRGKHHARHLQRTWDKYGEGAFRFAVLETCLNDPVILRCREQHWLDKYRCNLFNSSRYSEATYKKEKSEEHKEKLRRMMIGNQYGKGKHGTPVLTERQVVEILHRFAAGELRVDLAERFNVTRGNIARIVSRKSWASLVVDPDVDRMCRIKHKQRLYKSGINGAKLDWDKVDEVRRCHAEGETYDSLSQRFSVCRHSIYQIVTMRTWIRPETVVVELPPGPISPPPLPKAFRSRKQRVRETKGKGNITNPPQSSV